MYETGCLASGALPLLPAAQPPRRGAREGDAHRRTALVALRGELDLFTVSKVAQVLDELGPQADGVRHVVLDLRGLTFIDVLGLHELLRQNEFARINRHHLAVLPVS